MKKPKFVAGLAKVKETVKETVREKVKGLLPLMVVLAPWYAFTSLTSRPTAQDNYPLPPEIRVIETSLPYEERKTVSLAENLDGSVELTEGLERIVNTMDIDFSGNFYIRTERYNFIKDDDTLPIRAIGHIASVPRKLIFWNWGFGLGQDETRSRATLSMLENNASLTNLTVRLNHNDLSDDLDKLFEDGYLKDRNNSLARATMGISTTLISGIKSGLGRNSYYNPFTNTAVCYDNIESTVAHELGHHKDFQRFGSDWKYLSSRAFPPVMLYQEWQASKNAQEFLSDNDQGQFKRYLLPGFFAYLLAAYHLSKGRLQKKAYLENGDNRNFRILDEKQKPKISQLQTLRHLGTLNAGLYAGIESYHVMSLIDSPNILSYGGFAAGMVGTCMLADRILGRLIPYNHKIGNLQRFAGFCRKIDQKIRPENKK